ncbi:hypothetical protein CEXT_99461 [Caerostris extrusa]|uniref:Uncharacterized protein n=1 Tax=Caerostris extrusa TaxID=172846 RepID=A0AAV4XI06_CAEEX|nr:hypothetical protein CEXT_99461 [Caerostris extrusa]
MDTVSNLETRLSILTSITTIIFQCRRLAKLLRDICDTRHFRSISRSIVRRRQQRTFGRRRAQRGSRDRLPNDPRSLFINYLPHPPISGVYHTSRFAARISLHGAMNRVA